MSSFSNRFFIFIFTATLCTNAVAQPTVPRDTTRRTNTTPAGAGNQPRPYKEIITDKAKTDDGLFKVHKEDYKYYFEIHDSLMNNEILVVNRISKTTSGMP